MMKSGDVEKLVRENIKKIQPYTSARDDFKDFEAENIFLDANENPFGKSINRYPDPNQSKLKKKISELYNVGISQIFLGNGSDEVLDLLMRVFCEPKVDSIITLPPTYGMYAVLSHINDIYNKRINLTLDFQPNVEAILNYAVAKMIFFCSPNNPTGNSFEKGRVEQIIKDFQGIVVIDEAYIEFSSERSWIERLEQHPNLVITRTCSKAYGMAGARLGICYASPYITSMLRKIKSPYNINTYTQDNVLKRFVDRSRYTSQLTEILEQRQVLLQELKAIPFVIKIYPTDANFILIEVDDADKRYKQLITHNVILRNRSKEPLCHNALRLTIGTPQENKTLIRILKKM